MYHSWHELPSERYKLILPLLCLTSLTVVVARVDPKLPLPQPFINFIMKNVAGVFLNLFQRQVLKVPFVQLSISGLIPKRKSDSRSILFELTSSTMFPISHFVIILSPLTILRLSVHQHYAFLSRQAMSFILTSNFSIFYNLFYMIMTGPCAPWRSHWRENKGQQSLLWGLGAHKNKVRGTVRHRLCYDCRSISLLAVYVWV